MKQKLVYTVEEVMSAVSISRHRLYQAMANNDLRSMKIGRLRRFTAEAVRDFIAKMEARHGSR
jgi:excisionase family DNA binding protein